MTTELAHACDDYLARRTGCYDWRSVRYRAAAGIMDNFGLTDDDIVLDVGAGGTEFDYCLRQDLHWRGRYWPVDGWMGTELADWSPGREVHWSVALELIEHLYPRDADVLVDRLKFWSTKGVIISTPNPKTTDVLGMDETHRWAVSATWLAARGFMVQERSFYGQPNDSLFACWIREDEG